MAPSRPFRAAKITDRCFAAVIRAFIASPKFQNYSPATREVWGRELRLAERPDTLGAISVNIIRPALVQAFMDGMSDRPGKQTAALAALRQLERWAIVRDLLAQPITLGVEVGHSHDGHRPWTDQQVRLAETNARPELAKVVTLGANTGQRGSDLVKMRWTDIEDYKGRSGINVVQVKTGKEIWVPITHELAASRGRARRSLGHGSWSATAILPCGPLRALCCMGYAQRPVCGCYVPERTRGRLPTWSACRNRSSAAIVGSLCSAKMPPLPCCIWIEPLANGIARSREIWGRKPLNHNGLPFSPNMTKARLRGDGFTGDARPRLRRLPSEGHDASRRGYE
jgi:hypothetical protein